MSHLFFNNDNDERFIWTFFYLILRYLTLKLGSINIKSYYTM